jgi:hypothetical protein
VTALRATVQEVLLETGTQDDAFSGAIAKFIGLGIGNLFKKSSQNYDFFSD